MCGIVGIHYRDERAAEIDLLDQMTASIQYRGPDGLSSILLNQGSVGFGHAHLAIIDLSDYAKQPMQTKDGRYTITYNGELYNYREIKKELMEKGCSFFSNSDTEVVLRAYAYWGEVCLEHFNGMFAFAVWDKTDKVLSIARNRYGIKPLYYYRPDHEFIFASEQKAILMHPG